MVKGNQCKKLDDINFEASWDSDSTASNSSVDENSCNIVDTNKYDSSLRSINTVSFTNSKNIQIGDRIIYNGPVTIKNDILNVDKELNISPNHSLEGNEIVRFKFKRHVIIAAIAGIVLILGLIFGLKLKDSTIITSDIEKPSEFKFYSRESWGARPPDEEGNKLNLPLKSIIICHTVMRNCYSEDCCMQNLHQIQDLHMARDFGDIGYNFVICNDGSVYEGVGWNTQGAHTYGQNRKSFGIAFNGDFSYEVPNKNQINSAFLLFDEGVRLGKLIPDYKIYGARQYSQTFSPGEALYQMIQTWDHWSEKT